VKLPERSACALLSALAMLPVAHGATDGELEAIRKEIQQLRSSYEARIEALEQKLRDVEARGPAVAPSGPLASGLIDSRAPSIAAFNPAISATLQGVYARLRQDPERYRLAGFLTEGEIGPGRRGLSVGESEMIVSANVDPRFAAQLVLAYVPEGGAEVEEAYGLMTGLDNGVTARFGRFLSGIGYLNEQHQHAWDFFDAPLAYEAFLGRQLAIDGAQLKWIAPTEQYLELNAEVGNGDAFPGSFRNSNGAGAWALGVHTGGDVGSSHSWRAGLSWLRTRASERASWIVDSLNNDAQVAFTGRSNVAVADFVWKYAPGGNARETNIKLQGEYFRSREGGALTYDRDGALGLTNEASYAATQRGWYLQGVWQFMPGWRAGARYDRLNSGTARYDSNGEFIRGSAFDPQRTTVMADWSPSEFSRWRVQAARSRVRPEATDYQVFLQYILTIGAHGGHKF
jgi:hypothetical protein